MSSNGEIKFLTHEVGSLAKPPWLVKTSAGKPLKESDIEHAKSWGERLEVDGHEQLVELLRQDERDPDEIARWSSRYCMRLQESAGVDWIWDGGPAILQSRAIDETGYVQPKINQLRAVRGTRSIYHNNAIQSWKVAESGEVTNVQVY